MERIDNWRLVQMVVFECLLFWVWVSGGGTDMGMVVYNKNGNENEMMLPLPRKGDVSYSYYKNKNKNAYAAMMYMGTPRDYEFYVGTRVMMRTLAHLGAQADLVVIASKDVPLRWVRTLEQEDGMKVIRVENLHNPYIAGNSKDRFKLTMNKLYAWSLVEYDRVVMIDADNLFTGNTDELFQCGEFCAVFINPCIFHTGLFVLKPSNEVFKDMLHELESGRPNSDGADQGFLGSYFSELLDMPMFHHPAPENGTKLNGKFRLPLGYQMDASYYYLKLRWNVPCGPNSVITFPSAVYMKPWYWWSWPVLPLGMQWHEQRRRTIGYSVEIPMLMSQAVFYIGIIALTRIARPSLSSKLCYLLRTTKTTITATSTTSTSTSTTTIAIAIATTRLKSLAVLSILAAAYVVPFFFVPRTVHPVMGWSLYLLGSFALCSLVAVHAFQLPLTAVLTLWIGIAGVLIVMAFPWYKDGVVRALAIFAYSFCSSPFLWVSINRVMSSLQMSSSSPDREAFLIGGSKLGDSQLQPPRGFNKLY